MLEIKIGNSLVRNKKLYFWGQNQLIIIEIMKRINLISLCALACLFLSCKEKEITEEATLNLTTINVAKSQVVSIDLSTTSLPSQSFSINGYIVGSQILDPKNKYFGYQDIDYVYHLIDIISGSEVKQFPLSFPAGLSVFNPVHNELITHYYEFDSDGTPGKDRVVRINLNNGQTVSDIVFTDDTAWTYWVATGAMFDDQLKQYILIQSLRSYNPYNPSTEPPHALVFINPFTGQITKTVPIDHYLAMACYNRNNNRVIGLANMFYDPEIPPELHIVTVDFNTGNTLSCVRAQGLETCHGFEYDYDAETNCYILRNEHNQVLFFDVTTGEVVDSYQLDFEPSSLRVWRTQ